MLSGLVPRRTPASGGRRPCLLETLSFPHERRRAVLDFVRESQATRVAIHQSLPDTPVTHAAGSPYYMSVGREDRAGPGVNGAFQPGILQRGIDVGGVVVGVEGFATAHAGKLMVFQEGVSRPYLGVQQRACVPIIARDRRNLFRRYSLK